MTFSAQAALSHAVLLATAARSALANAMASDSAELITAAAVLETMVVHGGLLAVDMANPDESHSEGCTAITHPNADHVEGPADQRAYNLARLAEHAGRLLAEQPFDDRRLGAEIIALVLAAAVKFDAVSLALEQRDRAALLATAA